MMEMCFCCCCCSSNQNKEKNKKTFAGRKSIAENCMCGQAGTNACYFFLTFFKRNANEQHKNR